MTSRFTRWFDQKYGAPRQKQDWVKCHLMCGVKTNVVTAVEIHDMHAADSPQLPALVDATAKSFTIREVSLDKGYSSGENHDAIAKHKATPYIAFKNNTTGSVGGLFEKMFHFFSLNRDEFLRHYHKRSNVESTFSMIILHAARNETSSNSWKLSVMSDASLAACVVGTPSNTS